MLSWFELVSGLRINLTKSKLYQVGEVTEFGDLANVLGCKIDTFPAMYLGLPLGVRSLSVPILDRILEKVASRLAGEKLMPFLPCI